MSRFFYGEKLKQHITYASSLERRDFAPYITKKVNEGMRVPILISGLRRTGKTIMLEQVINDLPHDKFEQSVLININSDDQVDMSDILFEIETLTEEGFRNFFIDEITNANNFINRCQIFADNYCRHNCTFVLSGTNSLTFSIAEKTNMLGRREKINSTIIPYGEWARLLYNNSESLPDIDKFLLQGGILDSQGLPLSTSLNFKKDSRLSVNFGNEDYITSAIALNIQNSLLKNKNCSEYKVFQQLLESNTLTNAISRIIEDENHSAGLDVFNSIFYSHDFSNILINASNQKEERKILYSNKQKIQDDIKVHLGISDDYEKLNKEQAKQLVIFLEKINFFSSETHYIIDNNSIYTYNSHIIIQPGIRTEQIVSTYKTIVECLKINSIQIDSQKFKKLWLSSILGKVLEEWIRVELTLAFPYDDISKISWKDDSCEFDIMITKENGEVHLLEVKHSLNFKTDYAKNFRKDECIQFIERNFGPIRSKRVLYLGKNQISGNILYQNIEHFLHNLYLNSDSLLNIYQENI